MKVFCLCSFGHLPLAVLMFMLFLEPLLTGGGWPSTYYIGRCLYIPVSVAQEAQTDLKNDSHDRPLSVRTLKTDPKKTETSVLPST